ncbi:MAG: DNA polymerase III subunit alpha [Dehalococcoidales bacterium]|nr:DNA polymerase III subunit alpha [Dehalococcoidales bacterium]
MAFVHLHVHSPYSFYDGASSLDKLLDKAVSLDMPALAITDHDRLTAAVRFYQKAKALGIKPIIGAEVTLEGGYHLTLLCKNTKGYSKLCRLLTKAHLSSKGREPQTSREMLAVSSEGLIALSGCDKGEIPSLLYRNEEAKLSKAVQFYREVFADDFFIELIRYPSRTIDMQTNRLAGFAREEGLPVVATNNVHYAEMEEYRIKEMLNAIGQNIPVSQLATCRTVEQYLKSEKEMRRLFRDIPEALANTEVIASRCNLELELGKPRFPKFTIPEGETDYSYLTKMAHTGVSRKYRVVTAEILNRLDYELDTIRKLGFCGYFLVVWDIVRWAREQGIRCQARGSAVDSLVVYALDISNVNPIEQDLLFERFMHPLRRELPDIDLDVDRTRREEARDYIHRKYGDANVACVSTINTYMARGSIRDVGKVLQIPKAIIEEACKGIHYLSAERLMKYADSLPELKNNRIYRRDDLNGFFQLCTAIDGFPKHLSVHLGGLLITSGDLTDMVPLERSSGGDIISQYDKDDIESLGIVKLDLLSLPTLTVIGDTIANIKKERGIDIDLGLIPKDDPETFAMLRDGKTIGTFQLESPAQREMAGRMMPDCFEDIIISLSLVRPGPLKSSMDKTYLPRRHGTEPVRYIHPKLKNALGETLGVILYQEQVLRVAHDLAGMSYAEADGFRRAMTHDRTHEEMEKMRDAFISNCLKRGISQKTADKVFEQLAAFAAYGFCKAHAAAYAELAYQTIWLKCHYPAEFFAAVLSNQPMGYYPCRVLVADARRFGVRVLPVEINKSESDYTVENGAIRVSLRQVKRMSEEALNSILSGRNKGDYLSLMDFVTRTNLSRLLLERLLEIGAFDSLGSRGELLKLLPKVMGLRGKGLRGPVSFIDICEPDAEVARSKSCSNKELMLAESEILSLNLCAHPLEFYQHEGKITRMIDLPSIPTGSTVEIIGSVIRYQTPPARNGKRVVYVIMEDGTGIADITVFSDVQEKCGHVLFREGWLSVQGKVQRRGQKALSIIAEKLSPLKSNSEFVKQKAWGKIFPQAFQINQIPLEFE